DGELWLDDGTVVIVANGAVAYRVYKGTLGSVSPVFRDLMADSNLKDSELMDGVPVVHVDDAPENLRHFLNFLAQPRFDTIHPMSTFPLSYASLAAVGRIGRKYQVESAVHAVTSRLLRFFAPPPTLWVDAIRSWSDRWQWWKEHNALEIQVDDAIDAVNLIRLLDEPAALPFALYLCSLCDPVQLRDGIVQEDGSIARLSDEDFGRCVRGSLFIAQASHGILQYAIGSMKQGRCQRLRVCTPVLVDYMSRAHAAGMVAESYPLSDVFIRLNFRNPEPDAYALYSGQLCSWCKEELCSWSVTAARDIFLKLSRMFDVESDTLVGRSAF
ncbi:hypothetical protein K466DRAFT_496189, partial [Polyporus arcularius HHB13444]